MTQFPSEEGVIAEPAVQQRHGHEAGKSRCEQYGSGNEPNALSWLNQFCGPNDSGNKQKGNDHLQHVSASERGGNVKALANPQIRAEKSQGTAQQNEVSPRRPRRLRKTQFWPLKATLTRRRLPRRTLRQNWSPTVKPPARRSER
ncbi:hypothetical protein [Caballeronia choica]|jgi:hypothetical protein|uniref:hypothetical protein n=1 Tax=Caballeronia choica TaxID=326476 RepID=UPI000F736811|nr:hypothetical protein [Caballeronia choica]